VICIGVLGGNRRCSYVVRSAEEIVRSDIPVESTPIPQITLFSVSVSSYAVLPLGIVWHCPLQYFMTSDHGSCLGITPIVM
jgi:hypothetical protein